jgi:hypothetical protein
MFSFSGSTFRFASRSRAMAIAAMAVALPASATAIVIDDFSSGTYSIFANSATPNAEAVRVGPGSSLLGTQRDVLLQYLNGFNSIQADVTGGFQYMNNDSETGGAMTLQYDGIDGELESDFALTNGSSLGANFSADDGFKLIFPFVNGGLSAPLSLTITVATSSGTFSNTSNIAAGTNIVHIVAFTNFAGANFSDVQRLDFRFNAPASADFTLNTISTAPEPATMAGLCAGLLVLIRRRKR